MAITGSYSTSTGVDFNLVAYYSYEQNTANNTSTVTVTLKLRHKSLNATSLSGSYLSVAGNQVNYTKKISQSSNTVTETTLATKTVTIQHNDTTGQGSCGIKGTFVLNGSYSGKTIGTLTLDNTLTLQTIPRASSLSVPSSVNTGSELTVTITPANSTFKHAVEFKVGATIVYASDFIPAGTNTKKYSISHAWFPSSTSGSIVVYLHTYRSDGTLVATVYKVVTAKVPTNIVPSISDFTASIYSGGLSGLYVQGKSITRLTTTAAAGSGSSIVSYTYSGPDIVATGTSSNSTSATWITSTIRSSGTLTYKVEVEDARGRKASKTVQIYVYPYGPPTFGAITVQRSTSAGTLSQSGTYASYTVNSTYSSVNGKNTRTVTAAYSSNNGSTYSTATTIQSATNLNNSVTGVYGGGALSISNSYLIKFTITDSYGATASIEVPLKSAERAFNMLASGKGVAIGKMAETSSLFDVGWDTRIRGNLAVDGVVNSNSVYKLHGATTIPSNADFNSYITPGTYIIKSNNVVETVANRPTAESGVLIVYQCAGDKYDGSAWSYITQEYTTIGGTTYHRSASTGATANVWTYGNWAIKSGRQLHSLGSTGYQKLPSGLIIAWGYYTITHTASTYNTATVTFPITFPNDIVYAHGQNNTRAFHRVEVYPNDSRSGATIYLSHSTGATLSAGSQSLCRYLIIGY
jgi:hypothetical protein